MNMPMWSCRSLVTLSARLSVLPRGSNSSSRLRAPFLSWVHTSISSWQYANVQFSPYWHSWRSCTSVGPGRENTQQNINVMVIKCVSDRLHIPALTPHGKHTLTEYKSPQEIVPCRPGPNPLPGGVVWIFETTQQHISFTAMCCLWLILIVHHSWTWVGGRNS